MLVQEVNEAFETFSALKIESCFQTLRRVWNTIVQSEGENIKTNFHRDEELDELRLQAVATAFPERAAAIAPMTRKTKQMRDDAVSALSAAARENHHEARSHNAPPQTLFQFAAAFAYTLVEAVQDMY